MSSRKTTRTKKTKEVIDLVDPKGFPSNCADIQAFLKGKVGKLSSDAQQELKLLLPSCDQNEEDLLTALNNNPFFWSSLQEWHDLLKSGHLKSPKKTLSDKDLLQIPYKDDNFEYFWGERLKNQEAQEAPKTTVKRKRGRPRLSAKPDESAKQSKSTKANGSSKQEESPKPDESAITEELTNAEISTVVNSQVSSAR